MWKKNLLPKIYVKSKPLKPIVSSEILAASWTEIYWKCMYGVNYAEYTFEICKINYHRIERCVRQCDMIRRNLWIFSYLSIHPTHSPKGTFLNWKFNFCIMWRWNDCVKSILVYSILKEWGRHAAQWNISFLFIRQANR